MWEHIVDEIVHDDGDETLVFDECTKEGCNCKYFQEDNWEAMIRMLSQSVD